MREKERMIEWKERDRKIIDIGCLLDETFTVGWRERERDRKSSKMSENLSLT